MKVFVYFNLHKKCFSVKALEGPDKGRVIAHRDVVYLQDAVGKVSKAGRERVLREKRKNVHAGVVGRLIIDRWEDDLEDDWDMLWDATVVTYNPYKYSSFVNKQSEEPWQGSTRTVMTVSEGRTIIMGFDKRVAA